MLSCKLLLANNATIENTSEKLINNETTLLPDTKDEYPGCKFKGNYIYAGAINLVWNDVKRNITGEDLKLVTNDHSILHFVNLMNKYPFTKQDLDSESYFIKSGFGQPMEDQIN